MKTIKKKILISMLAMTSILASSVVAFGGTVGFGTNVPGTGVEKVCTEHKTNFSDYLVLSINETSNNNKYSFYGTEPSTGTMFTRSNTVAGTGWKQTSYYDGGDACYNANVRLILKTSELNFTPMWIAGNYTP